MSSRTMFRAFLIAIAVMAWFYVVAYYINATDPYNVPLSSIERSK